MFITFIAQSFVILDGNVEFLLQDFDFDRKKLKVTYKFYETVTFTVVEQPQMC